MLTNEEIIMCQMMDKLLEASNEEEKKIIKKQKPDTLQRSMLISSLKVEPQIPIFITYFTIYPDVNGKLQYFSDVYGYDKVIFDVLKSFGVK